eukprot:2439392-Amphidinium_carterae.1
MAWSLLERLGYKTYSARLRKTPPVTGLTLGRCRGHIKKIYRSLFCAPIPLSVASMASATRGSLHTCLCSACRGDSRRAIIPPPGALVLSGGLISTPSGHHRRTSTTTSSGWDLPLRPCASYE